jgi:tetraacyldisaccharide 4'-kinase
MNPVTAMIYMPLSTVYRVVTQARAAAYRNGLFVTSKLAAPVISIGNLTTGGTGKTPLVEWVCRVVAEKGVGKNADEGTSETKRVCVLSRGYGRANPNMQVVVSNGAELLATEREAGDEPFLLAKSLLGIAAVISNSDRVAAGQWAIENLNAEVFVLDDGFQHLRLARDLNIVTIDATNPWGGGSLLPNGRLREPVEALSRADCIVITRTEQAEDLASLRKAIQQLLGDAPVFSSRMVTSGIKRLDGEAVDAALISQPLAAFCGVGNPGSFFNHLRREGLQLVFTRAFADHHSFNQSELDAVIREAKSRGAQSLITTAKDAIKLESLNCGIPCYVLEIQISIDEDSGLVELIRNAISLQ